MFEDHNARNTKNLAEGPTTEHSPPQLMPNSPAGNNKTVIHALKITTTSNNSRKSPASDKFFMP